MIDPDLLQILCCPATHQAIRPASPSVVTRLNAESVAGNLKTVKGAIVSGSIEAGLIREDGRVLYQVKQGIPVLLVEEGIDTGFLSSDETAAEPLLPSS